MKIIKGKFCMPCRMLSQWLVENNFDIPEEFSDETSDVEKYGIKQTPALITDDEKVIQGLEKIKTFLSEGGEEE